MDLDGGANIHIVHSVDPASFVSFNNIFADCHLLGFYHGNCPTEICDYEAPVRVGWPSEQLSLTRSK